MSKKRSVTSIVFFVLSLLAFLIITVFCGSLLVEAFEVIGSAENGDGFGVAIGYVFHIVYGAIGYGVSLIFGIVATAVARGKRRAVFAIVGIVLPLVCYFAGIGLFQYVTTTIGG